MCAEFTRAKHIYVGFFHVHCEMMTKVMNLDFTNSIFTPVMQSNGTHLRAQRIAAPPCRSFLTTSSPSLGS